MTPDVIAATGLDIWGDLFEVIVYGTLAGTGLTVIIALTIRAFVHQGEARRAGQRATATKWAVVAFVCLTLSGLTVAAGLVTMLHS